MTDKHTPAAYAREAEEAIRALTHVTISTGGQDGWQYPSDTYEVIGGLDHLAMNLPQALGQVWSMLSGLAADGHVSSDRGTTDADLTAARAALDDAAAAARALQMALARAHSATSPLSWQD